MNLKPIGDKVLIERVESISESRGVFIPETVQNTNLESHIVAVGEGRTMLDGTIVPMEVKIGDSIVYAQYSGHEIKIDGEEFVVFDGKDILAIVV